jgi:hypothetical protein
MLLVDCYCVDRQLYARQKVQQWLGLRLTLTVVASASCIASALGLVR